MMARIAIAALAAGLAASPAAACILDDRATTAVVNLAVASEQCAGMRPLGAAEFLILLAETGAAEPAGPDDPACGAELAPFFTIARHRARTRPSFCADMIAAARLHPLIAALVIEGDGK